LVVINPQAIAGDNPDMGTVSIFSPAVLNHINIRQIIAIKPVGFNQTVGANIFKKHFIANYKRFAKSIFPEHITRQAGTTG